MRRVVLLALLGVGGCLLGVELGDVVGFEDGEACEEEEQCLKALTCSFLEGVCRPSCLNPEDCDEGRVCVTTSEGEILEDYSLHFDGCIPVEDLPDPEDLPDDVRYNIVDGDDDDDTGTTQ